MKTLAQIRAALPTHIPLIRGVHKWQKGDQILGARYIDTNQPAWIPPVESVIGQVINATLPVQRPIPPEVLDHQAWEIATMHMDETAKICTFGEEKYREMAMNATSYSAWLSKQIEAA